MKKLNKKLTFLFLIASLYSIGQKDSTSNSFTPETYKHKFGMAAGITTGVGFSYQFKPNRFGVMVTGIPIKDGEEVFVSGGLTLRYDVAQTKWSNIFLYQGNHYMYTASEEYQYSYISYQSSTKIVETQKFNTGVGLGLELFLGDRFTSNFMVGYAIRDNFQTYKPTVETGIYFRF